MTAALAYLARKQSDTIGLYAVNDKNIKVVQPRFEQQQFIRFLNELVQLKSEGTWDNKGGVEQLFDHHGKEMIIFMTDLYDDAEDLQKFISRLKTPRNEVLVFHLMGNHETEFDFKPGWGFQFLKKNIWWDLCIYTVFKFGYSDSGRVHFSELFAFEEDQKVFEKKIRTFPV